MERFTGTEEGIVTWIDVHTGLGPSGKDTLMPDGVDSKLSATKETEAHFPGAFAINHMTSGSGDVAAGYELTTGTVGLFYLICSPTLGSHWYLQRIWDVAWHIGGSCDDLGKSAFVHARKRSQRGVSTHATHLRENRCMACEHT